MKRQLITIVLLLSCTGIAIADPLSLVRQLYHQGGKTLYCQTPFASSERFHLDFIYNRSELLNHFGCITESLCENNAKFQAAYHDLHNIYVVTTGVATSRIGTFFAESTDNATLYSESCDIKTEFQTFTPPDQAKGNVARAMIYMSNEHDLPLRGSLTMYQRWNKLDPPDQEELDRNQRIKALQGNSNPYIDNPGLMDENVSSPVIQFNFQ